MGPVPIFAMGELVPEHFSWYFHVFCHFCTSIVCQDVAVGDNCTQVHMMYREIWVHRLNKSRLDKGEFYSLYLDLRHYPQKFFTFFRMPVAKFDEFLWLITPRIRRKSSNFHQPISPEQQL